MDNQELELGWSNNAHLAEIAKQLQRIADVLENPIYTERLQNTIYNAITQSILSTRR